MTTINYTSVIITKNNEIYETYGVKPVGSGFRLTKNGRVISVESVSFKSLKNSVEFIYSDYEVTWVE